MQIVAAGGFAHVTIKIETTSLLKGLRGIRRAIPAKEMEEGEVYCLMGSILKGTTLI